jgi:DNA-binding NarL/FixJ family response regulator
MIVKNDPIRVLLADDHAIVRAGIRQFLERAGDIQVVAEADDGEMAKNLIQQKQPDVAVLDIQMPKSSGIEVTRWVRVPPGDDLTAFDHPMSWLFYRLAQMGIS